MGLSRPEDNANQTTVECASRWRVARTRPAFSGGKMLGKIAAADVDNIALPADDVEAGKSTREREIQIARVLRVALPLQQKTVTRGARGHLT